MTDMREGSIQCVNPMGVHNMAYVDWGDADNPCVLMCVHGLTRCSRDFDALAQRLARHYRVVCPDVAGRGRSDWLPDGSLYTLPQYATDMLTLIAMLAPQRVHWVGTSMGGLIGMGLAAQAPQVSMMPATVSRLVLNDVGPVLSAASLQRIGMYLGKAPRFDTYAQAEGFVRAVSAGFGTLTDAQWQHLATHVLHRADDGRFEFRYDPAIALSFEQALLASGGLDVEMWPLYDAIACPTLLLRGEHSDLLTPETAQAMTQRGPHARLVEFPAVGHAPVLMDDAQIDIVEDFLLSAS